MALLLSLLSLHNTLILFLKLPNLFVEQLHQFLIFHDNLLILLTLYACRHVPSLTILIFSLIDFYHRKLGLIIIERIVFRSIRPIINYSYNEGKLILRISFIFHFFINYFISSQEDLSKSSSWGLNRKSKFYRNY